MPLDPVAFFRACNPSKTLTFAEDVERDYYVDFGSVRAGSRSGVSLIQEMVRTISRSDAPCHQLFTGHIGSGKSTELHKLKLDLEQAGFHVVLLDSSDDLVMSDVDFSDILLVIAKAIDASLTAHQIRLRAEGFAGFLQNTMNVLQREVSLEGEATIPGLGHLSAESSGQATLSVPGVGKITARLKENANARERLRQYLEPRSNNLLELINGELIDPATARLKEQGRQGLVVIVDSLDRLEDTRERSQAEYIFLTRGEQLRQLHSHMVYTVPMVLNFSDAIAPLSDRFGGQPKVLPMVRVLNRDGSDFLVGMKLLRQMILARAFPALSPEEREDHLGEVFEDPALCHRLCRVSGGHVRNLLVLLYGCLQKEDPPIRRDTLEEVIATQRDSYARAVTTTQWQLLQR